MLENWDPRFVLEGPRKFHLLKLCGASMQASLIRLRAVPCEQLLLLLKSCTSSTFLIKSLYRQHFLSNPFNYLKCLVNPPRTKFSQIQLTRTSECCEDQIFTYVDTSSRVVDRKLIEFFQIFLWSLNVFAEDQLLFTEMMLLRTTW